MDPREVSHSMFETQFEAAVRLVDIRREKETCRDGFEQGIGSFVSFIQEELSAGLKEMGTYEVQQGRWTTAGMRLHGQNDVHVDHMFREVFMENTLLVGYLDGLSYAQNVVNSHLCKTSALAVAV